MNNRKKKGFTLIELIVVIAILAVLGLLIVPQISGYIDATQATTCQNNRKLVERAITVAEAKSGKTETFTTPAQVAAIKDSLYDGGKICPKEGAITITGHKVTCSIHKDETSSGGFIKDGTIMDQRDGAINKEDAPIDIAKGTTVKINIDGTDYWVRCITNDSCKTSNLPTTFPFDNKVPSYWKNIAIEWNLYNNYETNDIIKFGDKYYYYKSSGYATNLNDPSKNTTDYGLASWNDTTKQWEVPKTN